MKFLEELRRRPWLLLELGLAAALVSWRCVAPTWHPVWLDIFFYLGLYWAYLAIGTAPRLWTGITLALMLGFLAIYMTRQMPHALLAADLLP